MGCHGLVVADLDNAFMTAQVEDHVPGPRLVQSVKVADDLRNNAVAADITNVADDSDALFMHGLEHKTRSHASDRAFA